MKKTYYSFLSEPKTKIGWVHGSLTILFSFLLSYLVAMIFSSLDFEDYAVKIVPAMILVPILVSFFGIWLLNSVNILSMLKKFLLISLILSILLFIGF